MGSRCRIVELENEGHRGHAMEVLKANAIDLARRIDELRSLLVESPIRSLPSEGLTTMHSIGMKACRRREARNVIPVTVGKMRCSMIEIKS